MALKLTPQHVHLKEEEMEESTVRTTYIDVLNVTRLSPGLQPPLCKIYTHFPKNKHKELICLIWNPRTCEKAMWSKTQSSENKRKTINDVIGGHWNLSLVSGVTSPPTRCPLSESTSWPPSFYYLRNLHHQHRNRMHQSSHLIFSQAFSHLVSWHAINLHMEYLFRTVGGNVDHVGMETVDICKKYNPAAELVMIVPV